MIGRTLAHYEITQLLGKGGMGEVYRARDTKLGRDVALKVLSGMADRSGERLARFRQEARAIAALSHPNIVTLFAVEEAEGVPFLTMELVEGVSLSRKIENEGLGLDELLAMAVPIADAVSSAHKQGITHRDLKPDNVMIDGEGRVKVLDFGLAKLLDSAEEEDHDRTIAVHHTQEGRILGTAAYMSPEQAEGKAVDARSDVFSLGIVLYEMATGRKPFQGETAISTISSIVKEQPPSAHSLNQSLPRQLGRILDRCLAKDPERRYQSALELRNELEVLDRESKSGELEAWTGAPAESVSSGRGRPLAWIVALAVVAGVTFLLGRASSGVSRDADLVVTSIERLTSHGSNENYPSLAPSGDLFAYQARDEGDDDIFLQRRGGQRPINLTADSPARDVRPAIAPDGESIVFESTRQGGGLFVMGATGENVRRVSEVGHHPAWAPDGKRIAYSTANWFNPGARDITGTLWTVDLDGSDARQITGEDMDAVQPDWSRDGRWIVFWGTRAESGQRDLWMIRSDGSQWVELTNDEALDWSPRFAPDGRSILFLSNRGGANNLWRLPIDPAQGKPRGAARPVTLATTDLARFDIAANGREIVHDVWTRRSQAVRVELSDSGGVTMIQPITKGTTLVTRPMLSPGGQTIVFTTQASMETQDVLVVGVDGSGMRRLMRDPYRDRGASWHPSGERIVFYSDRGGFYEIWSMRPDGSDMRQLTNSHERGGDSEWFPRYSGDGRRLATMNQEGSYVYDVDEETGALENMRRLEPPVGAHFFASDWQPSSSRLVGWIGNLPSDCSHGLWMVDVESGRWTQLVEQLDQGWISTDFTADGQLLYLMVGRVLARFDLDRAPFVDLRSPGMQIILAESDLRGTISIGPDASWLVTESTEASSEIWVAVLE